MAGKFCDVCGKDDLPTIVHSSGLGAISFAYCKICDTMGAEPKLIVKGTEELCGGLENIHENMLLTYYEKKTDSYYDLREENINIKFGDGSEVKTRTEAIEKLKEIKND